MKIGIIPLVFGIVAGGEPEIAGARELVDVFAK
jgi:hypothetical protein